MGIELLFMFSPFAVVLFGLLGERFKVPKLREVVAIILSAFTLMSVWLLYNLQQASPTKILVLTLGGAPPLGACFEIDISANSNLKGDAVLLNKQDNGKEINVRTGEVIRIELERYGSTRYEWYPDKSYGEHLEHIRGGLEDVKKSPVKGTVGIPVRRWWELRAAKKGETEILIYLYRDWEGKDKAVDSFKVKVKIF